MQIDIGKALAFELTDEQLAEMFKHAAVWNHVVYIGLRNTLMDSHASVKREDFETEVEWRNASKAKAEMKLAKMLQGEIRANSAGPRASKLDAIGQEALKLARVYILGKLREKPELIGSYRESLGLHITTDEKDIKAAAIAKRAARADVIATATANVKAANELMANQSADDLGL